MGQAGERGIALSAGAGHDRAVRGYSIIETARENGLNPLAYLTFEELPQAPDRRDPEVQDRFLPWSQLARAACRMA